MTIKWNGLHDTLKTRINQVGDPFGAFYQDWFVDANNGNDNYDGRSWDSPFKTIANAMTAAALDAGAVRIKAPRIYVAPGDYDESGGINLNIENMMLIGANRSPNHATTMLYSGGTSTEPLLWTGAHNVAIYNMGLVQTEAYASIMLGNSASDAFWKGHIAGCKFDGWATCTFGIGPYDATVDCPDLVIEDNLFRSIVTANIKLYNTRTWVLNNKIFVDAAGIGIDLQSTGGNRPDQMVVGNWILGSNSTDTGIKIASTEPTDGTLLAALNVVTNCATNITQDKSDAGVVCNFTYLNGTGLGQVDPNA